MHSSDLDETYDLDDFESSANSITDDTILQVMMQNECPFLSDKSFELLVDALAEHEEVSAPVNLVLLRGDGYADFAGSLRVTVGVKLT